MLYRADEMSTTPLNRGIAEQGADSLRVRDVRDGYRLIGDCRDLGGLDDAKQPVQPNGGLD